MTIIGRNTAFAYAGAEAMFGVACEGATPRRPKHVAPSATKRISDGTSFGHPTPKNTRPATTTIVTCIAVLVIAWPARPARYADDGSGVPWMRLRIPSSRRYVRFMAIALKVVDITLIAAIP